MVTTGDESHLLNAMRDDARATGARAPALRPVTGAGSAADPVPADASYDGTHMLQLSLFLMLLTFFLVLNANATFDARRVGPVIGGVQSAFGFLPGAAGGRAGADNGSTLPVPHDGTAPASGSYASAVREVFFSVGAVDAVMNGRSFDMSVEADELFVGGAAAIRSDRAVFFANLAAVLGQEQGTRRVAVLVPEAPRQRLDARRAASLARLFLAEGMRDDQIAVGMRDRADGRVLFRFYAVPGAGA
ncbi:MAG: hypothetical protein RLO08_18620 [Parvibaculaceae bacterium]